MTGETGSTLAARLNAAVDDDGEDGGGVDGLDDGRDLGMLPGARPVSFEARP